MTRQTEVCQRMCVKSMCLCVLGATQQLTVTDVDVVVVASLWTKSPSIGRRHFYLCVD